jgi:ribosomal protein L37AE/L43A
MKCPNCDEEMYQHKGMWICSSCGYKEVKSKGFKLLLLIAAISAVIYFII